MSLCIRKIAAFEAILLNQNRPRTLLRLSYEAEGSYLFDYEKKVNIRTNAELFPLLKETSKIGNISPFLSKQWNECKSKINLLLDRNLIFN